MRPPANGLDGNTSPVRARTVTPLLAVVSSWEFTTSARTEFATSLMAFDTATEIATPTFPTPALKATAFATEEIVLSSRASTRTRNADMMLLDDIRDSTLVAMRLVTPTPAPAAPTPTIPAATAAAPAVTSASIFCVDLARTCSSPVVCRSVSTTSAVTAMPPRVRSKRCHRLVSR